MLTMTWLPYFFGTRFTVRVCGPDPLAHADQVLVAQSLLSSEANARERSYRTPLSLFFLLGPFTLITRTSVRFEHRVEGDRLIYDLHHPLDIPLAVAMCLMMDGPLSGRAVALLAMTLVHGPLNYFLHRSLVKRLSEEGDPGTALVAKARGQR
jgi:hypothetical protein